MAVFPGSARPRTGSLRTSYVSTMGSSLSIGTSFRTRRQKNNPRARHRCLAHHFPSTPRWNSQLGSLNGRARSAFISERGTMSTESTEVLFTPYSIGDLQLKNRIVMAPLTRTRAENQGKVPNALMTEYYAQRAGAGLIITEGTFVSEQGQGWYGAPGVYTTEQAAGWKRVTDAVHSAGGLIFVQLWHQ